MIARLQIPGAWMWSAWQPDRGMPFNSYLFERDGGAVAVDPLPLGEGDVAWLESIGGVRSIVLTNRDHVRGAQALRERFGARILAHEPEAALFAIPIDGTFGDGDEVFPGARAIALPHGKTAGEVALHLAEDRCAVVGDAVIGAPAGGLSLLPDEKLEDPHRLALALRRLWELRLESVLLADGQPLFGGADAALAALIEERAGAGANRINLDELQFATRTPHAGYECDDAEVGLLLGARKLGYRIARIPAGAAFCPLHEHAVAEEFFYVVEGTPSVRTARGTIVCRPGDFIAFPAGKRGAHQLRNDSGQPALVLLVGMEPSEEVCFYPDSRKLLVAADGSRLIVAAHPALAYFDGE